MSMTFAEALAALEASGSEQTRRTYLRHGASEPLFGVKFSDLRPLAKRIGTDQALAQQLWASGNADARLLACLVADPSAASGDELDAWLDDIDSNFLVDTFVTEVAYKAPGRRERAERWIASECDPTAQAGWELISLLARSAEALPAGYLEAQLELIAQHIGGYGNWTRRAASSAISAIGLRSDDLEAAARRTAARIGSVEFDPGQTACVMPDPIEYLDKTKAHRAKVAAKRAGS